MEKGRGVASHFYIEEAALPLIIVGLSSLRVSRSVWTSSREVKLDLLRPECHLTFRTTSMQFCSAEMFEVVVLSLGCGGEGIGSRAHWWLINWNQSCPHTSIWYTSHHSEQLTAWRTINVHQNFNLRASHMANWLHMQDVDCIGYKLSLQS